MTGQAGAQARRIMICAPNWLGDCVMALPAIREFRLTQDSTAMLAVMTKAKLKSFWELVPFVDAILTLEEGLSGIRHAADSMRRLRIDESICFTNSFRSALPAWLAGIQTRRGTAGHWRRGLLTDVIDLGDLASRHQAYEYSRLLGIPNDRFDGISRLIELPCGAEQDLTALGLSGQGPYIALIPGAARGVSKQWPEERFAGCVERLLRTYPHHLLLLGTQSERELCQRIGQGGNARVHILAGQTSIRQMAELLAVADVAIVNDSGGMHLAAALGTPVVALYGLTDPDKTGPLGLQHEVLAAPGYARGRDIAPSSLLAVEALSRISVDDVMAATDRILRRGTAKLTSSGVGGI